MNTTNALIDDNMFKEITKEKAFLLGVIARYGSFSNYSMKISMNQNNGNDIRKIRNIISIDIPIEHWNDNKVVLTIKSPILVSDVRDILNDDVILIPEFKSNELKWHFLRGCIENDIKINTDDNTVSYSASEKILQSISSFCSSIPHSITDEEMCFVGVNCLDFLGNFYHNCGELHFNYYKDFLRLLNNASDFPDCKVYKADERAVIPFKSRFSDAGFDLTIISIAKKYNNITTLYDTGIKLRIPHGYYAEIVPRSSLSKFGYMLANSVGIIDNAYTGSLFIPLTKVDPDSPDLELPFRCCQLIFRKQVFVRITQDDIVNLHQTTRGSGGFGSSG